jgi:hypothetical protein
MIARSGREHVQQGSCETDTYSITSSARASSVGGTVSPSALVVVRLIANSNLVDRSTGRSPAFFSIAVAWRIKQSPERHCLSWVLPERCPYVLKNPRSAPAPHIPIGYPIEIVPDAVGYLIR